LGPANGGSITLGFPPANEMRAPFALDQAVRREHMPALDISSLNRPIAATSSLLA